MAAAVRDDRTVRTLRRASRRWVPDGADLADASGAPGKATADSDVVNVRFTELVPSVRIVQAVDFASDDPAVAGTMTMTWELVVADDGTRVDIRAEHVPDGISAADHAAGLASSLANLAAYLDR